VDRHTTDNCYPGEGASVYALTLFGVGPWREKRKEEKEFLGRKGNTYTHERLAKAEGSIKAVGRETRQSVTSCAK